ncbi:ABC transporter permease [Tritonibacter mobilis]|uniref:ABC transporter permease n=1 Tax=Tritonibacter mobilis TaxID=379347 RepID=UPI0039A4B8A3
MRIERRQNQPKALLIVAPMLAVLAALSLAGILIALAGVPVLAAYKSLFVGAFGSKFAITETLTRATPLIVTGLAAAVAFRARIWNIGAEGQFYMGALLTTVFGFQNFLGLPSFALIPALFLAGALAGMVMLVIPLGLRLRFGVDEVVTTLLLNFVVLLFVSMMLDGPMKDPLAFGWPQSVPIVDEGLLPKIIERTRLHLGLIIAIAAAVLIYVINAFTVFGLEAKAAGFNPAAAKFAGVPFQMTLIKVACLSGGLAGLAGAIEVMGVKGQLSNDLSASFGYTGIVVAMLASLNPIGVIFAAIFTAMMFVGAESMSRSFGIPSFIADVVVSLSLLTMLVAIFFSNYRIRK